MLSLLLSLVGAAVAVVFVATAAGAVEDAAAGTFYLIVGGLPRPITIFFFFFLPAFFERLVVEFPWKALLMLIDFLLFVS